MSERPGSYFWCAGQRFTSTSDGTQAELIQEIIAAESKEHARDHFESFWGIRSDLALSQNELRELLDRIQSTPSLPTPEPFVLAQREHESDDSLHLIDKYWVSGELADRQPSSVVVEAASEPDALLIADFAQKGFQSSYAISESSLAALDDAFEAAKAGDIPIARAPGSNQSDTEDPHIALERLYRQAGSSATWESLPAARQRELAQSYLAMSDHERARLDQLSQLGLHHPDQTRTILGKLRPRNVSVNALHIAHILDAPSEDRPALLRKSVEEALLSAGKNSLHFTKATSTVTTGFCLGYFAAAAAAVTATGVSAIALLQDEVSRFAIKKAGGLVMEHFAESAANELDELIDKHLPGRARQGAKILLAVGKIATMQWGEQSLETAMGGSSIVELLKDQLPLDEDQAEQLSALLEHPLKEILGKLASHSDLDESDIEILSRVTEIAFKTARSESLDRSLLEKAKRMAQTREEQALLLHAINGDNPLVLEELRLIYLDTAMTPAERALKEEKWRRLNERHAQLAERQLPRRLAYLSMSMDDEEFRSLLAGSLSDEFQLMSRRPPTAAEKKAAAMTHWEDLDAARMLTSIADFSVISTAQVANFCSKHGMELRDRILKVLEMLMEQLTAPSDRTASPKFHSASHFPPSEAPSPSESSTGLTPTADAALKEQVCLQKLLSQRAQSASSAAPPPSQP